VLSPRSRRKHEVSKTGNTDGSSQYCHVKVGTPRSASEASEVADLASAETPKDVSPGWYRDMEFESLESLERICASDRYDHEVDSPENAAIARKDHAAGTPLLSDHSNRGGDVTATSPPARRKMMIDPTGVEMMKSDCIRQKEEQATQLHVALDLQRTQHLQALHSQAEQLERQLCAQVDQHVRLKEHSIEQQYLEERLRLEQDYNYLRSIIEQEALQLSARAGHASVKAEMMQNEYQMQKKEHDMRQRLEQDLQHVGQPKEQPMSRTARGPFCPNVLTEGGESPKTAMRPATFLLGGTRFSSFTLPRSSLRRISAS